MAAALQQLWFGNDWRYNSSNAPALAVHALDANNDALGFLFQAMAPITITRLGCKLGTITGTTPSYRISLQGITSATTAEPNGTIKGATNNALKVFSPSSLGWAAGSWNWLTLDETYTCTRGEVLSIVIDYSSGTVDGSNNATFAYNLTGSTTTFAPKAMTSAAATWSTQTAGMPIFGYGSAGTAYGRPLAAIGTVSLTNASSPREVGMKWTAPASWGNTFQVAGSELYFTGTNNSGNITQTLYQGGNAGDTTGAQDVAISGGFFGSTLRRVGRMLFDEASLTALSYGSTNRIGFQTAGGTLVMHYIDVASADDMDAYPGGQNVHYTQRDSGGNWTDTTTRRLTDWQMMIADITEPSSGGILTHPGMSGGCRG